MGLGRAARLFKLFPGPGQACLGLAPGLLLPRERPGKPLLLLLRRGLLGAALPPLRFEGLSGLLQAQGQGPGLGLKRPLSLPQSRKLPLQGLGQGRPGLASLSLGPELRKGLLKLGLEGLCLALEPGPLLLPAGSLSLDPGPELGTLLFEPRPLGRKLRLEPGPLLFLLPEDAGVGRLLGFEPLGQASGLNLILLQPGGKLPGPGLPLGGLLLGAPQGRLRALLELPQGGLPPGQGLLEGVDLALEDPGVRGRPHQAPPGLLKPCCQGLALPLGLPEPPRELLGLLKGPLGLAAGLRKLRIQVAKAPGELEDKVLEAVAPLKLLHQEGGAGLQIFAQLLDQGPEPGELLAGPAQVLVDPGRGNDALGEAGGGGGRPLLGAQLGQDLLHLAAVLLLPVRRLHSPSSIRPAPSRRKSHFVTTAARPGCSRCRE